MRRAALILVLLASAWLGTLAAAGAGYPVSTAAEPATDASRSAGDRACDDSGSEPAEDPADEPGAGEQPAGPPAEPPSDQPPRAQPEDSPPEEPEPAAPSRDEESEGGGAPSGSLRPVATAADRGGVGDGYIVVYERSVDEPQAKTRELERQCDIEVEHSYTRVLEGFAAEMSAEQAQEIRAEPGVAAVVADRQVKANAQVPLASGDSAPTGVRRIRAATTTTAGAASGAHVAILDTGIDLDHPDLNVRNGHNCVTPSASADDDQGHGTHLAGTIAARNDGSGVVGVAPNTRLYAVKVLDADGNGSFSSLICGIEWATSTRSDSDSSNDISAANMSLSGTGSPVSGCSGTSDPLHRAICSASSAGLRFVAAAGNGGRAFDSDSSPTVPAAYPEVLTATAMADSDGAGGAAGPSACGQSDDRFASFSNHAGTSAGRTHTIAGPAACIRSTARGGGYGTLSGTSMAASHVTGALALCLRSDGNCDGMTSAQVIQRMRSIAEAEASGDSGYGFAGDPDRPDGDRYFGYLVSVGAGGASGPAVGSPSSGSSGSGGGSGGGKKGKGKGKKKKGRKRR